MTDDIVIVSAVRTPIGDLKGSLSELRASELGSIAIKEALNRARIDPGEVSEVIFGQVLTAGQGQNTARQTAVKAGIPYKVPAFCINMLCGSGLKAVIIGYQTILSNEAEIVVCGGQESMSQAQHAAHIRAGKKMGDYCLKDTMLTDGLTDAFYNIHMGETAENIAEEYRITREQQDEYSLKSQQKAERAMISEKFKKEIVPVVITKRNIEKIVSEDEYPKLGCTLNSLKKLKSCFRENGTVTAGNASGINDGAAALVLMRKSEAKRRGLTSLCRIVAVSNCGIKPLEMGLGPIKAIENVLSKAGWTKDDVDLYEVNEAFASQSIIVINELGLNEDKVNVHGGAIALGHPIGASGARVLVTLLHALEQVNGKRGVVGLCVGGGMGVAMAVERL